MRRLLGVALVEQQPAALPELTLEEVLAFLLIGSSNIALEMLAFDSVVAGAFKPAINAGAPNL